MSARTKAISSQAAKGFAEGSETIPQGSTPINILVGGSASPLQQGEDIVHS